jgi:hypothetical protein
MGTLCCECWQTENSDPPDWTGDSKIKFPVHNPRKQDLSVFPTVQGVHFSVAVRAKGDSVVDGVWTALG